MKGPPPHTPHPGYLSVRLLHCRGHGPATRRRGAANICSSLSRVAAFGGQRWGMRRALPKAGEKAQKLRERPWVCGMCPPCDSQPAPCWPWEPEDTSAWAQQAAILRSPQTTHLPHAPCW